jgi:hypothetical protein
MSSFYFTTAIFLGAPSAWKSLIAKNFFLTKNVYFFKYHSPLPAHLHIVTIDGGYCAGYFGLAWLVYLRPPV